MHGLLQGVEAIFWTAILLSILVFIHEGGHFLTARAFGVRTPEFMIGLPGPNIGFTRKGTKYGVTAIPLGGYVKIAGMEPGKENPLLKDVFAVLARNPSVNVSLVARELGISEEKAAEALEVAVEWDVAFHTKPEATQNLGESTADQEWYQMKDGFREASSDQERLDNARKGTYRALSFPKKLVVLSSGVIINILAAIVLFTLLFSVVGIDTPQNSTTIGGLTENSPAKAAGIEIGDTIKAIDGTSVSTWDGFVKQMDTKEPGQDVAVTIDHDGTTKTVEVKTGKNPDNPDAAFLGVSVSYARERMPFTSAMKAGGMTVVVAAKSIAGFFNPNTFSETVQQSSSIVGIAAMTGTAASQGFVPLLSIFAAISLSLGLMNILPIPPLDGGKVAIEIGQKITRRQFSPRAQMYFSLVGMGLLLCLVIYLTGWDIFRLITKAFPWQ